MKRLLVLRPEPGNAATCRKARAMGLDVMSCPLFAVEALAWRAPDPAHYHALLLTSANALRQAGPELTRLAALPVAAVGEVTAAAARAAGFLIICVGSGGVEALLAAIPGRQRLLHLAGADHVKATSAHHVDLIPVYQSVQIDAPPLPDLRDTVVAVHSMRAATRLADLASARSNITIAAISNDVATACGTGWARIAIAPQPSDAAMLALVARLCQD